MNDTNGNGSATTVLITVVIVLIIGLAFYFGFYRSGNAPVGGSDASINIDLPSGNGGTNGGVAE